MSSSNPLTQSAIQNAYQLGLIAKSSRNIALCRNFEELADLLRSCLEELSLSGCFQMNCFGFKRTKVYGLGLDRESFELLENIDTVGEKILWVQDLVIFSQTSFILIVRSDGLEKEGRDCMRDNLALYTDTIQSWIDSYTDKVEYQCEVLNRKKQTADKIRYIIEYLAEVNRRVKSNHQFVVEHLTMGLASLFPVIGLECDQENEILGLVDESNKYYTDFINDQLDCSDEIKGLLQETLDLLEFLDNSIGKESQSQKLDKDTIQASNVEFF